MSSYKFSGITFSLVLVFVVILATGRVNAVDSKFRVGTINLSVAASLHPQMALFDFQKMGFYRVALGLPYEEYMGAIRGLQAQKPDERLQAKINEIDDQARKAGGRIRELINAHKTNNPARMPSAAASEYLQTQQEITELGLQKKELNYTVNNPEFTSPEETRKILQKIESEIIASVKDIAEREGFSLILNTSVPISSGYPLNYHQGTRFSTGPAGIDQALFYGFLAEKRLSPQTFAETEDYLRKWVSITGRPEAVEMLPIQPYPLVLEGGESILAKALEKIYLDYKIDQKIFDQLKKILDKLDLR